MKQSINQLAKAVAEVLKGKETKSNSGLDYWKKQGFKDFREEKTPYISKANGKSYSVVSAVKSFKQLNPVTKGFELKEQRVNLKSTRNGQVYVLRDF